MSEDTTQGWQRILAEAAGSTVGVAGMLAGANPSPIPPFLRKDPAKDSTEEMLQDRRTKYGLFPEHAHITQSMKRVMRDGKSWKVLDHDQREALEMICHKIGRILNGDPNYADSWADIAGYARLVEKRLNGEPI